MSVKIFYSDSDSQDFCPKSSLEQQLAGARSVYVSTEDDGGESAKEFLQRLKSATRFCFIPPITFKLGKSKSLDDARLYRDLRNVSNKILLSWAVQKIVYGQAKISQKVDSLVDAVKVMGG